MTRVVVVVLALGLAGCADREPASVSAMLGDLAYAVPDGWVMRDVSERQSTIVVWTPSPENPRKQSITIIRTPPLPAVAKAGPEPLAAWLGDAQRAMPDGAFSPAREITTKQGLAGVRVDGRFTPVGARKSYARTHVAIGDGDTLVHVIYTASEPDPEVLGVVLDHVAHVTGKAG